MSLVLLSHKLSPLYTRILYKLELQYIIMVIARLFHHRPNFQVAYRFPSFLLRFLHGIIYFLYCSCCGFVFLIYLFFVQAGKQGENMRVVGNRVQIKQI